MHSSLTKIFCNTNLLYIMHEAYDLHLSKFVCYPKWFAYPPLTIVSFLQITFLFTFYLSTFVLVGSFNLGCNLML